MDARARLSLALACLLGAGCAAERAACPTTGPARVLARGSLAYDAVAAGDAVYAIELETRFALVVHDAVTGAIRASIDLDGAARDLTALAVDPAGKTAWVGGRDQAVRTIDLARGAITASWPVGADVTALVATDAYVAIGDATGVVCLRRRADGALLQCLADADGPIATLELDGDDLVVIEGSIAQAYALPSLARRGEPRIAWSDGPFRPPVRFGGAIRSKRWSPAGLVIAAWVHDLDDPSVVLVPASDCHP